jgi:hypothetical protein
LIDELNVLDIKSTKAFQIAEFLKENFRKPRGSYFVFSSHVVPTCPSLANFMDSISERGVSMVSLPLIPNLEDARQKLDLPPLSARERFISRQDTGADILHSASTFAFIREASNSMGRGEQSLE